MKRSKLFFCALLTASLLVPNCLGLFASAEIRYDFTEIPDKAYIVAPGMNYREFTITSGVSVDRNGKPITSNTPVSASVLEFNTQDYVIIPYTGTAGGAAVLRDQYKYAQFDGYDVVGIMNASFFSTDPNTAHGNYGYMNDYIVSNGVVFSADTGKKNNMLCIDAEGNLTNVAQSQLRFDLYLNGSTPTATIGHVNKSGGFKGADNWGKGIYYFDFHSGNNMGSYRSDPLMEAKALTYECCPGYEVLCRKLNGSELSLGGTLSGEVLSVTANAYGGSIKPDEFILFIRGDSPQANELGSLKVGDKVSILANECIPAASEITTKATSITSNIGFLVKDGVNLAEKTSFTGAHSRLERARWSAIGVKADGSYVFFTTEGGSTGELRNVTLQDVARAMIELGCVDVVRFDGGGSSAIYVENTGDGTPGYKQYSSRPISDCLLIVRRSSPALTVSDETKAAMNALISEGEATEPNPELTKALAYAKSVVANASSVSGDYRLASEALRGALSGKGNLNALLGSVAGVNFLDYSEYVLDNLRVAYEQAKSVFGDPAATNAQVNEAYTALKTWYDRSGNVTVDGKEYTKVENGIFVTGINKSIETGNCAIFTPGTDISKMNPKWAQAMILEYSEDVGAYVLKQNFFGNGNQTLIETRLGGKIVPDGMLLISVHGDSGTDAANRSRAQSAKIGNKLVFHGIDLDSGLIGIGSYLTFEPFTAPPVDPGDEISSDESSEVIPDESSEEPSDDSEDSASSESAAATPSSEVPVSSEASASVSSETSVASSASGGNLAVILAIIGASVFVLVLFVIGLKNRLGH